MILREWRATAATDRSDAYPAYFRTQVLPALFNIHGFLGADLLSCRSSGVVEFVVLTRWNSMAAVRAFAGDSPGAAMVEEQAAAALLSFDPHVMHYDVVESTRPELRRPDLKTPSPKPGNSSSQMT